MYGGNSSTNPFLYIFKDGLLNEMVAYNKTLGQLVRLENID